MHFRLHSTDLKHRVQLYCVVQPLQTLSRVCSLPSVPSLCGLSSMASFRSLLPILYSHLSVGWLNFESSFLALECLQIFTVSRHLCLVSILGCIIFVTLQCCCSCWSLLSGYLVEEFWCFQHVIEV